MNKWSGLASLMAEAKKWPGGCSSAIFQLTQRESPLGWKFNKSKAVMRTCARALSAIPGATFEQWNELVSTVTTRAHGNHMTERAAQILCAGEIPAWLIDRSEPIHPDNCLAMSNSPGEARIEKAKSMCAAAHAKPDGNFCDLQDPFECEICGRLFGKEKRPANSWAESGPQTVSRPHNQRYINEWTTCRDKRCTTVATFFPKSRVQRHQPALPPHQDHHGGNKTWRQQRELQKA